MSKISALLLSVSLTIFCSTSGQQNAAKIQFNEKEHNFGTFRESDGIVSHIFEFINTGDLPLIINNVTSSCGCAVPSWPREPVIPGRSGIIRVDYLRQLQIYAKD